MLDGFQVRFRGAGWGRKQTQKPRVEWHEAKTGVFYVQEEAVNPVQRAKTILEQYAEGEDIKRLHDIVDQISRKLDISTERIMAAIAYYLYTIENQKYSTIEKMRSYASGLVNNWFRKDIRLNGGMKYEVKNPGSRQGAGDQQLKALKTLRDMKAGDAEAYLPEFKSIAPTKGK